MKASSLMILFVLTASASTCLHASLIGSSATTPGFSAADILIQGGAVGDGVYWIDPDLPGGDTSFTVYADMTTDGGGWTMAHDITGGYPTLDGHNNAITILAVGQNAELRFVGTGFDAYYTGNYYAALPTTGWTIISGNPTGLYGTDWNTSFSGNNVFVRETLTTAYPSSVPVPAAIWLFGSGLVGLIGLARSKSV